MNVCPFNPLVTLSLSSLLLLSFSVTVSARVCLSFLISFLSLPSHFLPLFLFHSCSCLCPAPILAAVPCLLSSCLSVSLSLVASCSTVRPSHVKAHDRHVVTHIHRQQGIQAPRVSLCSCAGRERGFSLAFAFGSSSSSGRLTLFRNHTLALPWLLLMTQCSCRCCCA